MKPLNINLALNKYIYFWNLGFFAMWIDTLHDYWISKNVQFRTFGFGLGLRPKAEAFSPLA